MSEPESLFQDARERAEEVRQWADLNGGTLDWLIDDADVLAAVEKALWLAPDVERLLARLDAISEAVLEERRWATGTVEHNDARTALYALVAE